MTTARPVQTANPITNPGRTPSGRLPELDGMRGLAVILVIVGHTAKFSLGWGEKWERLGGLGVGLFFALSGFLITNLLSKEISQTGGISLRNFWRNRSLRIFPAYYTMLFAVGLLSIAGLVTDVPAYTFAVCALFLRNVFGRGDTLMHTWSLALEQQFYIFWPICLSKLGARNGLRLAIILVAGTIAWRTFAISAHFWEYDTGKFYVRPDFRLDSILSGAVLALSMNLAGPLKNWFKLLADTLHPAAVLAAVALWSCFSPGIPSLQPVAVTFEMIGSLWLLSCLVLGKWARTRAMMAMKGIGWVGTLSYSIYLWQQLFLVTKAPSWNGLRSFPWDLSLAIVAGVISYFLVERPFLKLKQRKQTEHYS